MTVYGQRRFPQWMVGCFHRNVSKSVQVSVVHMIDNSLKVLKANKSLLHKMTVPPLFVFSSSHLTS